MHKSALIALGGFTMLAFQIPRSVDGSDLPWEKDVKTAIQKAQKDKRLVMLDFTAKW
ncbi:MAG: hypothetical protein O3B01_21760 [Planctomycetota bacterium]|nr:hypothetical protein [Planctomycetota bacterium]MDA1141201.1 hypothetical protein [Planctomycetota bacterium]